VSSCEQFFLLGWKLGFSRILDSLYKRVLTVFTRSAVTSPKVNRFGWNQEHSERDLSILSELALADFGTIRAVATAPEPCKFTDFPSAKFHEIWTQHVDRCCDETVWNKILTTLP